MYSLAVKVAFSCLHHFMPLESIHDTVIMYAIYLGKFDVLILQSGTIYSHAPLHMPQHNTPGQFVATENVHCNTFLSLFTIGYASYHKALLLTLPLQIQLC